MRYIQVRGVLYLFLSMLIAVKLVENEEYIGTLLECNERIIAALQMYDKVRSPSYESPVHIY